MAEYWCNQCGRERPSIAVLDGYHSNSLEEQYALKDELLVSTAIYAEHTINDKPCPIYKLTQFAAYDSLYHLVDFANGEIKNGRAIYFLGYIKTLLDTDPSKYNGVAAHLIGPITEWWITGYDGGVSALIVICTRLACYYLMKPRECYVPLWIIIQPKIYVSKFIIELLTDLEGCNITFKDMINYLEEKNVFPYVEYVVQTNAKFICEQVMNCERSVGDGMLMKTHCMKVLSKLSGCRLTSRILKLGRLKTPSYNENAAATTKLVYDVFKGYYNNNKNSLNEERSRENSPCGICDICTSPDCGVCSNCKSKIGSNKYLGCENKRCLYLHDAPDDETMDSIAQSGPSYPFKYKLFFSNNVGVNCESHPVKLLEENLELYRSKVYKSAEVGPFIVETGSYVRLKPNDQISFVIAKVEYIVQSDMGPFFHAQFHVPARETILGTTADPKEIFWVPHCVNVHLSKIIQIVEVEIKRSQPDWFLLGGIENFHVTSENDDVPYFLSKIYDYRNNRFVDYTTYGQENVRFDCQSCRWRKDEMESKTKRYDPASKTVYFKNESYAVGDGVLLDFEYDPIDEVVNEEREIKKRTFDIKLHPELYRVATAEKSLYKNIPKPYVVGIIEEIVEASSSVKIRIFNRPTRNSLYGYLKDFHCLYWTNKVVNQPFEAIVGKCYIKHEIKQNEKNLTNWFEEGPRRFYFCESYANKKIPKLPENSLNTQTRNENDIVKHNWDKLDKKLECLDIFCGVGGLSEGLRQTGCIEIKWAIENDYVAARAFQLNNPETNVLFKDCNDVLSSLLKGETKYKDCLPKKGNLDLLVGGPPCQGFCTLNRHNTAFRAKLKNSLVVTFLSYVEYFRPKYFIFENVRHFVYFNESSILQLMLVGLNGMGYQFTFGILQAGNYGVPQNRRRFFVMGAAPGYSLPHFPDPIYCFHAKACKLSFTVNQTKYKTYINNDGKAPYRCITVHDAISDLPCVTHDSTEEEVPYNNTFLTHFQKQVRDLSYDTVTDHVCRNVSPTVLKRIQHIPKGINADWRHLPNQEIHLGRGSYLQTLEYKYRYPDQKNGDPNRAVCSCANNKPCSPNDRQLNTLIPWCLVHTANRHNHWKGLYGRLSWEGYFATTMSNVEPMGKQGRCIHPDQDRLLTVRECARSQGFPDRYKFYGTNMNKLKQIGNAVPPPLALAIGRELIKVAKNQN